MGCFSFMCTECGRPINSNSFSGENVRLTLLDNGKPIEEMQGKYDSYGRVFNDDMESVEWAKPWDGVCDLMFDNNPKTGMAAAHVDCIADNHVATEASDSDPDQGWGEYDRRHTGKTYHYHKVLNV